MTMPTRRRFLTLTAAALACPARAEAPQVWDGRALGAAARIVLTGAPPRHARRVFAKVERALARIEAQFSLHVDSALTRLNRDGRLAHPGPEIVALFDLADRVHRATGGAFDPSVQPLWLALATGGDTAAARTLVGWERVRVSPEAIRLDPGMALTFNGIAQGAAADRIAALMRAEGFGDVLIDVGEIAGLGLSPRGVPWRAGIVLPDGTEVGRAALRDRALATSAPGGTRIGSRSGPGSGHILDPRGGAARWRLAAVTAPSAALADALSTAFCVMDRHQIDAALAAFPQARLAVLS